ncbi:hypothetical protein ACWIB8_03820 [Corynebacterium flavescens]
MPDISFDPVEAQRQLRSLVAHNQEQAAAHRASFPAFPADSAGRGFSGHAARLQEALERVHHSCAWRWDNLAATAGAAEQQFRALSDLDSRNGMSLDRVHSEREGGVRG